MKNFLDLLATDCWIEVEIITAVSRSKQKYRLLDPIELVAKNPLSVTIDGFEVVSYGKIDQENWHLLIIEPFYRWRHRVTSQGWLLDPQ